MYLSEAWAEPDVLRKFFPVLSSNWNTNPVSTGVAVAIAMAMMVLHITNLHSMT